MLLDKNISGQDFYDLLDFCFERSESFSLTYVLGMDICQRCKVFCTMLESHCFKSDDTFYNEVTIGPEMKNYYYACNKKSLNVLKLGVSSLFDLIQPQLLEDLTFYKENKAWFKLNSHEKYVSIEPYSEVLAEELDHLNLLYFD